MVILENQLFEVAIKVREALFKRLPKSALSKNCIITLVLYSLSTHSSVKNILRGVVDQNQFWLNC